MDHTAEWTPRDVLFGAAFTTVGLLVCVCGWLARREGWGASFWGPAWLLGGIFVLIGANAMFQSARSLLRGGRSSARGSQEDSHPPAS